MSFSQRPALWVIFHSLPITDLTLQTTDRFNTEFTETVLRVGSDTRDSVHRRFNWIVASVSNNLTMINCFEAVRLALFDDFLIATTEVALVIDSPSSWYRVVACIWILRDYDEWRHQFKKPLVSIL